MEITGFHQRVVMDLCGFRVVGMNASVLVTVVGVSGVVLVDLLWFHGSLKRF